MINQWLTLTESGNKEYPMIRGIEKNYIFPLFPCLLMKKKNANCLCYNFTTFFQRKQVIRKWFPATFDKNAKKEITKKTDKGQTKVSIISFQRY